MLTSTSIFFQLPLAGTEEMTAQRGKFSVPVYSTPSLNQNNWHSLQAYSLLPAGVYLTRADDRGVRYINPKPGLSAERRLALYNELVQTLSEAPLADHIPAVNGTPHLKECDALSLGYDLFGEIGLNGSVVPPIIDLGWSNTHEEQMPDGKIYAVPDSIVLILNPNTQSETDAYLDRENWQKNLSVSVGLDTHYEAFSGEFDASFQSSNSGSQMSGYTSIRQKEIIGSLVLDVSKIKLAPAFQNDYNALPKSVDISNYVEFIKFFQKYSILYMKKIWLGGLANITIETQKSSSLSSETINAHVQAQINALVAGVTLTSSVTESQSWQSFKQNSKVIANLIGGANGLKFANDIGQPFNPPPDSETNYNEWADSITTSPAIVDYTYGYIWELFTDGADNLKIAWETYGSKLFCNLEISTVAFDPVQKDGGMYYNVQPWAVPTISLSGTKLEPEIGHNPQQLAGAQVIILRDYSQILMSAATVLNKYYGTKTFEDLSWWDDCAKDIQQVLQKWDILILVTFNGPYGLAPAYNQQIVEILQGLGAVEALNPWVAAGAAARLNPDQDVMSTCYFCVGQAGQFGACIEGIATSSFQTQITMEASIKFFGDSNSDIVEMDLMKFSYK